MIRPQLFEVADAIGNQNYSRSPFPRGLAVPAVRTEENSVVTEINDFSQGIGMIGRRALDCSLRALYPDASLVKARDLEHSIGKPFFFCKRRAQGRSRLLRPFRNAAGVYGLVYLQPEPKMLCFWQQQIPGGKEECCPSIPWSVRRVLVEYPLLLE